MLSSGGAMYINDWCQIHSTLRSRQAETNCVSNILQKINFGTNVLSADHGICWTLTDKSPGYREAANKVSFNMCLNVLVD